MKRFKGLPFCKNIPSCAFYAVITANRVGKTQVIWDKEWGHSLVFGRLWELLGIPKIIVFKEPIFATVKNELNLYFHNSIINQPSISHKNSDSYKCSIPDFF